MKIEAAFVTSADSARDLPADLPRIALVGRSNVGKSTLINALVRQKLARTSAAPGKTRLANVYRVRRGAERALYLVDLPGFGFARGGSDEFAALATDTVASASAALLVVDTRHPGLDNDRSAWAWLRGAGTDAVIVATKTDKLARGERIRALGELESVFQHAVTPVSAVTGEGLDELWKLIDRLAHRTPPPRSNRNSPSSRSPAPTAATAGRPRRPPRRSSGSTSRR